MYRCHFCKKQTKPNQPINKIITKQREQSYTNLSKKGKYKQPIESTGWEIVKEVSTCPECFLSKTGNAPKINRKRKFKPKQRLRKKVARTVDRTYKKTR